MQLVIVNIPGRELCRQTNLVVTHISSNLADFDNSLTYWWGFAHQIIGRIKDLVNPVSNSIGRPPLQRVHVTS